MGLLKHGICIPNASEVKSHYMCAVAQSFWHCALSTSVSLVYSLQTFYRDLTPDTSVLNIGNFRDLNWRWRLWRHKCSWNFMYGYNKDKVVSMLHLDLSGTVRGSERTTHWMECRVGGGISYQIVVVVVIVVGGGGSGGGRGGGGLLM